MKNFIKTSLIIPKLCPFSLVRWFFVSFSLLQSEGQPGQLDLNQSWLGFYLWPERASPEVCYVGPGELSELWCEVHLEQDSLTSYKQKWWCINQRTLARKALMFVLVSLFVLRLHQAEVYFSVFLYFISLWFSFDIFLIDPVHFVLLGRKINRFLS